MIRYTLIKCQNGFQNCKKMNEVVKTKRRVISNKEKIMKTINKYPGLRFHQIKIQTKIANGTVQHHLDQLVKAETIQVNYQKQIPRYYSYDIEDHTQVILLRLRQNTTSKIIKSILKNECQTFSQMVKFSKNLLVLFLSTKTCF